jgi:hypothetical protein
MSEIDVYWLFIEKCAEKSSVISTENYSEKSSAVDAAERLR